MIGPQIVFFKSGSTFEYEGEEYSGDRPLAVDYLAETSRVPSDDNIFDEGDELVQFDTGSLRGCIAKDDIKCVISSIKLEQAITFPESENEA